MQTYCAKYGLYVWSPNLSESPYSIYNSACRLVALTTFRHALSMDAYAFTGVDTTAAADMEILIRIYDHFVHHLQPRLRSKESRNPGSVMRSARLNTIYRRRNSVGSHQVDNFSGCGHLSFAIYLLTFERSPSSCLKFLRQNQYPRRYQMLVCDPKANSDDEVDLEDGQYVIKRRLERSVQAETFFRRLDHLRRSTILKEGGQWRERRRKIISNQPPSVFPQLPKAMPIDYYSPEFFNDLSGPQQTTFANVSIVALSPDTSQILINSKKHADEILSDKRFFDKYAEGILIIRNLEVPDDQEDTSSQDGYNTESNHSMDTESGDEASRITRAQHKNRSPTLSVWPSRLVPEGWRVSYNPRQGITIDAVWYITIRLRQVYRSWQIVGSRRCLPVFSFLLCDSCYVSCQSCLSY